MTKTKLGLLSVFAMVLFVGCGRERREEGVEPEGVRGTDQRDDIQRDEAKDRDQGTMPDFDPGRAPEITPRLPEPNVEPTPPPDSPTTEQRAPPPPGAPEPTPPPGP